MSETKEKTATQLQEQLEKDLRNAANQGDLTRVQELIRQNVDVDAQDTGKLKRTALHWAAFKGHLEIVMTLLKAGADGFIKDGGIDGTGKEGKTAIALATSAAHSKVVDALNTFFTTTIEDRKIYEQSVLVPPKESQTGVNHALRKMRYLKARFAKSRNDLKKFTDAYEQSVHTEEIMLTLISKVFGMRKLTDADFSKYLEFQDKQPIFGISFLIATYFDDINTILSVAFDSKLKDAKEVAIRMFIDSGFLILITQTLQFERTLKQKVTDAIKNLTDLGSSKTIQHAIKSLKKLHERLGKEITHWLEIFPRNLSQHVPMPQQFVAFIREYFHDGLINCIALRPNFGPDKDNRFKNLSERNPVILKQVEAYINAQIKVIKDMVAAHKDSIAKHIVYVGADKKLTVELISAMFNFTAEDLLPRFLYRLQRPNHKWLGSELVDVYKDCHFLVECIREVLKNIDHFDEALVKARLQQIRDRLLPRPSSEARSDSPEPDPDLEAAFAKRQAKDAEKDKRAERKLAQEREKELLFQKEMLETKERKEKEDRKECLNSLLQKLNPERDRKIIDKIEDILASPQQFVLESDFLVIIKKLEISGSDEIKDSQDRVADNKITLSLAKYYSFTCHFHSKDGNVDQASVVHLKKMLESVGITKDNFRGLLAKLQNGAKKPDKTSEARFI